MEKISKYIQRLTKEWKEYGKIIIAVDFDSTISPWHTIDNKEDIKRTISTLKIARETGAYIIINTCCKEDRYKAIEEYCRIEGILIDTINKSVIDLPYGQSNKVYANIYLDDRGGLLESLDILEHSVYNQRSYITQGQYRLLNDIA
jgi:hypothetical protein